MNNKLSVSLVALILGAGISLIASERRIPNPDQVRKNLFSVAATQGIYAPTMQRPVVEDATQARVVPAVDQEAVQEQQEQAEQLTREQSQRLRRLRRQLGGKTPGCAANLFQ